MKMFYEEPMGNCTLEERLEKENIRELVEYERYCRDYQLFDIERTLWWDDGMVYATWCKSTVDDWLTQSRNKGKAGCHKVHNTVIWLNGNKAIAEVVCVLAFRSVLDDEMVDIDVESRLHFRVEKRDGKWGILYFEGIYEKDRMNTVFDDSTYTIPREELQQFRPCNWHQTYRLKKHQPAKYATGQENANDWCGEDRPETIERLYKESSEWFYN